MNSPFQIRQTHVPGLLDDAALRERLKQMTGQMNATQNAAPPPLAAAMDFADRIRNEYLTAPTRRAIKASTSLAGPLAPLAGVVASQIPPTAAESRRAAGDSRVNDRSSLAASAGEALMADEDDGYMRTLGKLMLTGPLFQIIGPGTPLELSPEERPVEAAKQLEDAKEREAAIKAQTDTRLKLRRMTDANAADLGFTPDTGLRASEDELRQLDEQDQARVAKAETTTAAKQKATTDAALQPTLPWWLDAARRFPAGIAQVPTGAVKGLSALWELGYAAAKDAEAERSVTREWMDTVDASINKLLPPDLTRNEEFISQVAQGSGSMFGYMLFGYLTATIGLPQTMGTIIGGTLTGGASGYEDAERFGADNLQKFGSLLANSALGATEAIPVNRMLLRAEEATGGLVTRMLKNTAASAVEEFVQELGQNVGFDVVATWYDEARELDPAEWLKAALVGAVSGGLSGAATSAFIEAYGPPPAQGEAEKGEASIDSQLEAGVEEQLTRLQTEFEQIPEVVDAGREIDRSVVLGEDQAMRVPGLPPETVAAVREATQAADQALPPKAAKAVTDFVGHPAGEPEEGASGIMRSEGMEAIARGEDPEGAAELEQTFAPIREQLREQVGDTVRLFRVQTPVEPGRRVIGFRDDGQRAALSWSTDPLFARDYAGLRRRARPLTSEKEIVRMEKEFEETGRVQINKSRWLERVTETIGDRTVSYIAIMGPDGMVTDTDSVRAYLEDENEFSRELHQEDVKRAGTIITADIPLNDVLWVTDRAGQSEFIVRNSPEGAVYIPDTGALPQQSVVHGRGGTIPVDTDGMFRVTHEAKAVRDVLDPAMRGSNGLGAGAEGARLGPPGNPDPDVVDRTYYGVGDLDFRRPPGEQRLRTDPYHGESIGHLRHIVAVDPNTIYNIEEDILNLRAQLPADMDPDRRVTRLERLIRDAGFAGVYFPSSDLGQAAMMFEKMTPERVINKNYGLPPDEIAKPSDFNQIAPESFRDKGGWAVVTATRESIEGGHKAPENIAANKRLRNFLKTRGIPFIEVGGTYKGVDQGTSLMIFAPEARAREIGAKYGQESVLTRRGLEFTDGTGTVIPAVHEETVVGDAAKEQDFFSTMPNGQAFSIGLDFGASTDATDADLLGARAPKPDRLTRLKDEIPGFKGVVKYMAPDEQAKMMKSNAKTIVDIFTKLPDPAEMAAVAFSGRAKRGWYKRSAQALLDIFGLEDTPRFAALLAALSPQTSVEINAVNTLTMWANWIAAGRPQDRKAILRIMGASVQGSGTEKSVLDAWRNNTVTALTDPDPATVVLSGPKVDSFMRNLRFEANAVTNDAWMANYAGVDQKMFKKSGERKRKGADPGAPGKGPGYIAMSAAVRQAAEAASKLTGETWTPAEIQETIWSWAKTLYEKASTVVKAEDLIKAGGLTHEEIGATPDFATLFVTGVYRNLLEKGGYDVSKIAAGSGQADGSDVVGGSPLSAEGAKIAQKTFERHLRNAARRLDELRVARAQDKTQTFSLEETFFPDAPGAVAPVGEPARAWTDEDADEFLASTSMGRGPYKAEQSRPKGGVAGDTSAEAGDVHLAGIGRSLVKLMDLTVRQGRFTLKGANVMGQFSMRQAVVRLRSWGDLSTLVHEAGHALDSAAGPELRKFIDDNREKFKKIAGALYSVDLTQKPEDMKAREGLAEFFRTYVLNKPFADQHFPQLVKDFEAVLDATAPHLKTGFENVRQQFETYLQLPSSQVVRNMIVPNVRETGLNAKLEEIKERGFKTWMHEVSRKLVSESVNRYAGIGDLVVQLLEAGQRQQGKAIDLKVADDPVKLIRLAANAGSRAHVETADGVMPYHSTHPSTRGLRDALLISQGLRPGQNLGRIDENRSQDFAAYLVALRGIDEYRRMAEGKISRPPVQATLGDLRKAVKELFAKYPEFKEAAEIVNEYSIGLWKKTYDAGLITKDTYEAGLDRRFYAPLQRDLSDKKDPNTAPSVLTGRDGSRSIVKRFRGSDRQILDPMSVLQQKTFALEQTIAKNEVGKALSRLASRAGAVGALVEQIPAHKLIGRQYSVLEAAKQITQDDSISEADAADLMIMLEPLIEQGKFISFFRAEQAGTFGENIVFYWDQGKLQALQLPDGDLGVDVMNTMNGLGREIMPMFTDLIAKTSTAFRATITSWPDFLMVNFIRDQFSAWLLTDVGYRPFVTGLQGAFDELRQSEWSKQYNAAMGIMGGMNVAALHKARVDRDISSLRKKGYLAQAFQDGPFSGLSNIVELTETGSRIGIFKKAWQRAKADGLSDYEASLEASYLATDYIDFGLNGTRMTTARRLIPFLNAQLQGLYKMMRTLGGDEVRQRKGLRFVLRAYFKNLNNMDLSRRERDALQTGRRAWVKMASLGLISAALHFLYEDDEDYQEAGEYLRTTGWVIPTGDNRIVYIPKPFELALLANFTERAFETAAGDPEAKKRFLRGMALTMVPPTSPPAIQVAVELAANRDFFAGKDIVPDYMQALEPELQYDHYTSELAKQIGSAIGASPMVLDHIMAGLGASAFRDLTTLTNQMDGDRLPLDAVDMPVVRRFVRDVRRGSTTARDFWTYASTTDGRLRRAETSYKNYIEQGREDAAEEYLLGLPNDQRAYAVLATHFKADAKRLNPFYRARQINTIVSAMRREMVSDIGLADTTSKDFPEHIELTSGVKGQLDEALHELASREMRNTLIYMKAPGWAGKAPLDTETTVELIEAISPEAGEEFNRRMEKAKVYSAEAIEEYWPEAQDRLLQDGQEAFLKDLVSVAKVLSK